MANSFFKKALEIGANKAIDHLKRSPVLNTTVRLVEQGLDEVDRHFQIEPIPLDDLVRRLSEDSDRFISNIVAKENMDFLGGHVVVRLDGENNEILMIMLKAYFSSSAQTIISKETSKTYDSTCVLKEDFERLLEVGEIAYEVNFPG